MASANKIVAPNNHLIKSLKCPLATRFKIKIKLTVRGIEKLKMIFYAENAIFAWLMTAVPDDALIGRSVVVKDNIEVGTAETINGHRKIYAFLIAYPKCPRDSVKKQQQRLRLLQGRKRLKMLPTTNLASVQYSLRLLYLESRSQWTLQIVKG